MIMIKVSCKQKNESKTKCSSLKIEYNVIQFINIVSIHNKTPFCNTTKNIKWI